MVEGLTVINLAFSWGLLALIWMVQTIIYPGFHRTPHADFSDYHRWYVKRIAAVVMPLMIGEAVVTVAWLLEGTDFLSATSAALVAVVWLSTFGWQVPIHRRLTSGKQTKLIRRLVTTNWVRTVAWSLKAAVVTVAVGRQLYGQTL